MSGAGGGFTVEVVAGERRAQRVVAVRVTPGETAADAWQRSGLAGGGADAVPELAVFGVRVTPDTVLGPGDRVEVLRPLSVDPREARRRRAALRAAEPARRRHSS